MSRRHLDYSTEQQNVDAPEHVNEDQAVPHFHGAETLQEQLQKAAELHEASPTPMEITRVLYEVPPNLYPPSPCATMRRHESVEPRAEETLPLVQTASAANERLEQDGVVDSENAPDPDPDDTEVQTATPPTSTEVLEDADAMSWKPVVGSNKAFDILIENPSQAGFGVLRKGGKNKVRGRFEDTRRKEVQEIRKRGACMRCRMLKKPCSEGTPCKTCQGVESARLWKGIKLFRDRGGLTDRTLQASVSERGWSTSLCSGRPICSTQRLKLRSQVQS